MPELPDVEVYKNYLTSTILQKKIEKVIINDKRVLECSLNELHELEGNYFINISRHGKYCFLRANKGNFLILHFGMTGNVKYYKDKIDPNYAALIILFSNEYKFAYINIRKLGKIFFSKDHENFIQKYNLGPDALSLDKNEFIALVQSKKGIIKGLLMKQEVISGIGNIYSDEILYQSSIHPQRKNKNLIKEEISSIYQKMQKILNLAIDIRVQPDRFPSDYLIMRREPGKKCGICSGTIQKKSVNGRPCYFCNQHQK
ncbi:MAG: DNA-formamidopyrimidine glycosylase family protein [Atribacterota bacterium]